MGSHLNSFHQWEIQDPEKLDDLSKISQLLNGQVQIPAQVFWFQNMVHSLRKENAAGSAQLITETYQLLPLLEYSSKLQHHMDLAEQILYQI